MFFIRRGQIALALRVGVPMSDQFASGQRKPSIQKVRAVIQNGRVTDNRRWNRQFSKQIGQIPGANPVPVISPAIVENIELICRL